MFYYELNVNGVISYYKLGVKTNKECKSINEVIEIADNRELFDNKIDSEFVVSYSKLTDKEYIQFYC
jgi:hypothetical protein